jgi:hypothetical protein
MRRTCTNCHAVEWPRYRWCDDCLMAAAKTFATTLAAAAGAYAAARVWSWLLS